MQKIQNVLLIPGYGQPHLDRWQHYEERSAQSKGCHVFYPHIPDFQGGWPTIGSCRHYVEDIFDKQGVEPDKTVVLAHSMGEVLWRHILKNRIDLRKCMTRSIAGLLENLSGVSQVNGCFISPSLPDLTDEEKSRILVVGSDNDAVINEHPSKLANSLGVDYVVIPNAGHFMPHALLGGDKTVLNCGEDWMTKVRPNIRMPY